MLSPVYPDAQSIFERAQRVWESHPVPAYVSFELPCSDTFLADRCPIGTHAQFIVRMSDGRTLARDPSTGTILMRGGYIVGPAGTPIGFYRSIVGNAGTAFSNAPPPNLAPDPFAPPSIATVVSIDRAYAVSLAGVETAGGHPAYHLLLRPLGDPARLPLRDLWVDERSYAVTALNYARKAGENDPWGSVRYEFAPLGAPPYWTVVRIAADLPLNAGPAATPAATLENISFPKDEPAAMFDAALPP
jgi:hypothetical protein